MPTISAWHEWPKADCAVCVGVFDGVHRGHAAILETTRAAANALGGAFCVLTFDKHPAELLAPHKAPRMITSLRQRVEYLDSFHPDVLAVLPFDSDMANTEPEVFVSKLMERGADTLVMGRGAAFGRGAKGSSEWLSRYAPSVGLNAIIAQPVMVSKNAVSSTAVRAAISSGNLCRAEELLGHPLPACEGLLNGKKISLDERRVLPPFMVYKAMVEADGCRYRALGRLKEGPSFEILEAVDAPIYASEMPVNVRFLKPLQSN